ncbi:MAG: MFS transporter [Cyanobacteria bacterium P01_A01_bin.45]
MHSIQAKTAVPLNSKVSEVLENSCEQVLTSNLELLDNQKQTSSKKSKTRNSLKASTIDGIFAEVFAVTTTGTTTGILLSNFLIELNASAIEIGMLSSIPMLVNLLQPLGAYISERTSSRHSYCLWTHGIARFLWLVVVAAIFLTAWGLLGISNHQLVVLTLSVILVSHIMTALGSASWLSWMAMLVPKRLRGRYFGLRNSLARLTQLICVPIAGLIVSTWHGGSIEGYGVVLFLGILAGFLSLSCQFFKADIDPQVQNAVGKSEKKSNHLDSDKVDATSEKKEASLTKTILKDINFLIFLAYFGLWMFAFNMSAPFFNLYMLDDLGLDVSWVTLYGSLQAGAGMLMLMFWGKLADRFGNRLILFLTGILVAITPILWLGIGNGFTDIWLWLPLLHILIGSTINAIELCSNNMQIAIAPIRNQSVYFAIAAAFAGGMSAVGTTIGSFLAQSVSFGLPGLFVLSVGFRLIALVPLMFVQESKRKSFLQAFQGLRFNRKLLARG